MDCRCALLRKYEMKKLMKLIVGLCVANMLVACGGGGNDKQTISGTAGNTQLAVGALDGTWACVGGPLTSGQILNGNYTDNQILQGTYTTKITFSGNKYFGYSGATASNVDYNMGVFQGPNTAPYYYNKTSYGDKLIYERYVPVLRQSTKIGVATLTGQVSGTSANEYSLDGNGKLLVTSYSPTPLPSNLTYSSASGGLGEMGTTYTTCNKV